ncbi:MAG: hypothetical protein V1743_03650 [Nanoarchaeota archaeon]
MKNIFVMFTVLVALMSSFALAATDAAVSGSGTNSGNMNPTDSVSVDLTNRLEMDMEPMVQEISKVSCDMGHPVVAFDVSKGQYISDDTKFVTDLLSAGYFVGTINIADPADVAILNDCVDVLIITDLQHDYQLLTPYTSAEGDIIKTYALNGGGLIVNSDWGPYFTAYTDNIVNKFGVYQAEYIEDLTDYDSQPAWVIYQEDNFAGHPITDGVQSAEMLYGGILYLDGSPFSPIITADADASPSNAIVTVAGQAGEGCVAVFDDTNWIQTLTSADGYAKQDNNIMAMNTVDWAAHCSEPQIPEFSLLAGGIALIGALCAFFLLRKR